MSIRKPSGPEVVNYLSDYAKSALFKIPTSASMSTNKRGTSSKNTIKKSQHTQMSLIDRLFDKNIGRYVWLSGKRSEAINEPKTNVKIIFPYKNPLYEITITEHQVIIKKYIIAELYDDINKLGDSKIMDLNLNDLAFFVANGNLSFKFQKTNNSSDLAILQQKDTQDKYFNPQKLKDFQKLVDYYGKDRKVLIKQKQKGGAINHVLKEILIKMDEMNDNKSLFTELYDLRRPVGYVINSYIYVIKHDKDTINIFKYELKKPESKENEILVRIDPQYLKKVLDGNDDNIKYPPNKGLAGVAPASTTPRTVNATPRTVNATPRTVNATPRTVNATPASTPASTTPRTVNATLRTVSATPVSATPARTNQGPKSRVSTI